MDVFIDFLSNSLNCWCLLFFSIFVNSNRWCTHFWIAAAAVLTAPSSTRPTTTAADSRRFLRLARALCIPRGASHESKPFRRAAFRIAVTSLVSGQHCIVRYYTTSHLAARNKPRTSTPAHATSTIRGRHDLPRHRRNAIKPQLQQCLRGLVHLREPLWGALDCTQSPPASMAKVYFCLHMKTGM